MDFISDNLAAIILVLAGLCVVAMLVMQAIQMSRLRRRIDQLTGGVESGDLEAVLGAHLATVHDVVHDLDDLTARMAVIESLARHHFSKSGLIRFNPFPDTGGNQSFALALLDESDDGIVVSSLHSRTGTRIYGKAIIGGKADTSLSTEEQEAVDEARAKSSTRPSPGLRDPGVAPRSTMARTASSTGVSQGSIRTGSTPVRATRPTAPAAQSVPTTSADETVARPAATRAKGQEKPADLVADAPEPEADPEKVGRKPGQR